MEKKRAHRGIALVVALALASTPATGRAGTWTGGASEWTQISNNIQLVLQYIQQVMMVINLVKQVAMMVIMTRKAKNFGEAMAIMHGMHSVLGTAAGFVFQGRALTDQWKKTHPGEKTPDVPGYGSIENAYDAIDTDLHAAAEQALKALDVHVDPNSVNQDKQIFEQLKNKAESAEGQMQAQQATNALLLEVIRQLQLIRQVNIIQARMVTLDASDDAQRRLYRSAVQQRDYQYRGLYRSGTLGGGGTVGGAPIASTGAAPSSGGSGGLAPQNSGPLFQPTQGSLAPASSGPLVQQNQGPLATQNSGSLAPTSSAGAQP